MLLRDFNLQLHLPSNRLCPPVPIRWLYVQWIQNLIETTRPDGLEPKPSSIKGLDIGVGASCVYPLLVCASRPQWRMYGTDIDVTNYQHAVHNVSLNEWDDRIKLLQTKADGPLIPLDALKTDRLDFTMCNPPFFGTKEEALATFAKDQRPFAACTGADVEMITPGGEVAYVRRMIDESTILWDKVEWYTVQLGKLTSLHAIVKMLKEEFGCRNWVVNVLQPSGQTVRWVLGWSWMPYRAPDEATRHKSLVGTGLQMEPNKITLIESLEKDPQAAILAALESLPLDLMTKAVQKPREGSDEMFAITVRTDSAVWSRSARRKRQREEQQGSVTTNVTHAKDAQNWTNTFIVAIAVETDPQSGQTSYSVRARWEKGEDRAIFESFCGMLKAKITSAITS